MDNPWAPEDVRWRDEVKRVAAERDAALAELARVREERDSWRTAAGARWDESVRYKAERDADRLLVGRVMDKLNDAENERDALRERLGKLEVAGQEFSEVLARPWEHKPSAYTLRLDAFRAALEAKP